MQQIITRKSHASQSSDKLGLEYGLEKKNRNTSPISEVILKHLRRILLLTNRLHALQLGALQFDKDLQKLITFFTGIAPKFRGEFARLTQISFLLKSTSVCLSWLKMAFFVIVVLHAHPQVCAKADVILRTDC